MTLLTKEQTPAIHGKLAQAAPHLRAGGNPCLIPGNPEAGVHHLTGIIL